MQTLKGLNGSQLGQLVALRRPSGRSALLRLHGCGRCLGWEVLGTLAFALLFCACAVGASAQSTNSSVNSDSAPIKFPEESSSSTVPPALQRLLQRVPRSRSLPSVRPAQTGLTIPSLWWVEQQFGQKTVLNWAVYPDQNRQEQQVHVYLRSNLWARFSYLERYAFVTHFGHLTRTYGHQLVMLESNGLPLASYICDFTTAEPSLVPGSLDVNQSPIHAYTSEQQNQIDCKMWLNPTFPRQVF